MKISEKVKVMLKSILDIKMGAVNTDKGELIWDGEEDLKAGDAVYVRGEGDELNPAADGEYVTEDNKTIVVVEGKVSEIRDPEAEVSTEKESAQVKFAAHAIKMSESYDDKYRKIASVLIAEGEDAYILEAGDEYAIKAVFDPDTYDEKYFKYSLTWEGDTPVAGESVEVKPGFIPVNEEVEEVVEMSADVEPADEPETTEEISVEDRVAAVEERIAAFTDGLNEVLNSIKALEDRIIAVETSLAEVSKPAAEPIDDKPEVQQSSQKSIMSYLKK